MPRMNNNPSRMYEYYRFRPPAPGVTYGHPTMIPFDSERIVLPQQGTSFPSKCVLCSFGYLCASPQMADHHCRGRHHHHALLLEGRKILSCKCSEVRYTGQDTKRRNAHWHCPYCYKPVKDRKVMGVHLIQVHSLPLALVRSLFAAQYPHW